MKKLIYFLRKSNKKISKIVKNENNYTIYDDKSEKIFTHIAKKRKSEKIFTHAYVIVLTILFNTKGKRRNKNGCIKNC